MRRITYSVAMLVVALGCRVHPIQYESAPVSIEVSHRTPTWDDFIRAVIHVESRGNDSVVGDGGRAIGCLQIHPICVREVNRILRKNDIPKVYTKQDRYSRAKSIEMFEIMAEQVVYCEELSFEEFCEIVARKWNGGPKGHHKKSTIKYWEKVLEVMTASKK